NKVLRFACVSHSNNQLNTLFCTLYAIDQIIKPSFTRKLKETEGIKGSFAQLDCLVSVAGSLPLSVEWSKGKQKITKCSKYKLLHIDNTISLELKLTESSDTGEYSCRVTNKAGNCVCSGILTAKVPPSFVAEPESQAVTPKSTVLFRSVFEGTPPFAIKWFKDDMELISGLSCTIRLEKYSSSVELYSVGTLQCGIYSCHISNDAGAVKSAAELLVKGWTILFLVHHRHSINSIFVLHFYSFSFFTIILSGRPSHHFFYSIYVVFRITCPHPPYVTLIRLTMVT
uniref:Ig-like domain-containing protein n=1 Tax=Seriola dumerili TaxID=41447 RepID=A0A3B4TID2_SERDU